MTDSGVGLRKHTGMLVVVGCGCNRDRATITGKASSHSPSLTFSIHFPKCGDFNGLLEMDIDARSFVDGADGWYRDKMRLHSANLTSLVPRSILNQ